MSSNFQEQIEILSKILIDKNLKVKQNE